VSLSHCVFVFIIVYLCLLTFSMYVEDVRVWTMGDYIYSTFEDMKSDDFLMIDG